MNKKKLIKHHNKLYNGFNKITVGVKDHTEKIKVYNKLLKIIEKLKRYEFYGKVKYETSLYKISEVIEEDKNRIIQNKNYD